MIAQPASYRESYATQSGLIPRSTFARFHDGLRRGTITEKRKNNAVGEVGSGPREAAHSPVDQSALTACISDFETLLIVFKMRETIW
jgi:hypothetical protein